MNNNPYIPIESKILNIIQESPNIKTFRLELKNGFSFKAGQFVELTVPGIGEAPFTPSSSPFEKELLELTIMNVGRVTQSLFNLKIGDTVGIRGPYGVEYPLSEFENKEILIVGGGVGLAPLRTLFFSLVNNIERYKKVLFCCGAKTPADLIYKTSLLDKWQKLDKRINFRITVDKADQTWTGQVGLVTCTLENLGLDLGNSVAIVCGPPIMMKFTTFKLLDIGYRPEQIFLSMEKNMSCGIGKCGHCRIGRFYVCKDGPVFRYDRIKNYPGIWD